MTVYVAGPMTGLPEYNYPAFIKAKDQLLERGYDVLSPTDEVTEKDQEEKSYESWLRRGFAMVLRADGIALLPGWENSVGANREKVIAEWIGLKIEPIEWWLETERRKL